jgi:hypothetical protein
MFGALSVFDSRIKGMITLQHEQVWTWNVTRHHNLLFPLFIRDDCLEEWCESVMLCSFLAVFVTVKWSGLRRMSYNLLNFI